MLCPLKVEVDLVELVLDEVELHGHDALQAGFILQQRIFKLEV